MSHVWAGDRERTLAIGPWSLCLGRPEGTWPLVPEVLGVLPVHQSECWLRGIWFSLGTAELAEPLRRPVGQKGAQETLYG